MRLDVELEPVRQLVLGDVDRKGRRERQIGQVIDVAPRCAASANDSGCASCRRRGRGGRRSACRRRVAAGARRWISPPGRRRPRAPPARGRHSCAARRRGRPSWRRRNRAWLSTFSPRCVSASSWPRSSSSVVVNVQASSRDGFCGSGTRRRMPLPWPKAVSNSKIASMHSVPARSTQRGGVRCGGMRKSFACVRAKVCRSVSSIAARPDMVSMVQVKARRSRQRPSARNRSAAAAASCSAGAANFSSHSCASRAAVACFLSATFIML